MLERFILILIYAIILPGMFFWRFAGVVQAWVTVSACLFLVICARSWLGRIACILLATGSLVYAGMQTMRMVAARPMTTVIQGGEFVNTPLPEVLYSIARQKQGWPSWSFHIDDRALAETNITVRLPERCTLQEGLEAICADAGADYQWRWFQVCGNAPEPGAVRIYLKPKPVPEYAHFTTAMSIRADHIYWSPEWRTNSTWIVPTNLPPTTFRADR